MKHTPGPWYITDRRYIDSHNRGRAYHAVAEVGRNGCRISKVDEANGKLISAAPDLLEACEALRDLCRENTSDVETRILKHLVDVINPAIKKATE